MVGLPAWKPLAQAWLLGSEQQRDAKASAAAKTRADAERRLLLLLRP